MLEFAVKHVKGFAMHVNSASLSLTAAEHLRLEDILNTQNKTRQPKPINKMVYDDSGKKRTLPFKKH